MFNLLIILFFIALVTVVLQFFQNKKNKMLGFLERQSFEVLLLDYQADKEKDPKLRMAKSLEAKIKRDKIVESQLR